MTLLQFIESCLALTSLLVLSRYYRTEPIEIKHVRQFAYGQYEDGELAIWAAGNAGWFKIQPAESYEETYQAMLDAINVFYFVADAHRDGSRKKTQTFPSAEALFEKVDLPGSIIKCTANRRSTLLTIPPKSGLLDPPPATYISIGCSS